MSIVAISVVAVLERAIGPRTSVLKSVALTILPGRKAPSIVAALTLGLVRRPVAERLRGVRRSARLRLKSLLRLRVGALALRRRGETVRQRAEIAIVFEVVALTFAGRSLLTALRESLCGLRSGDKSEIMLRVLQVIFRRDRIAASMSVSRKLEILFSDMMRVAAYLNVRSVRFIRSRQRIGPSPIVRRSAAHPLILTWSHFDFPISIQLNPSFPTDFGASFLEFGAKRSDSRFRVTRMG